MMRILIADDHTLVRTAMRLLLESIPEVEVVGEASDGHETLRLIEERRPDCVLLDLAMPGLGGLETLDRSARRFPDVRILVLSMHADEAYVERAIMSGAAGYLLKGADRAELEHALRVIQQGETYLSPAISKTLVSALTKRTPAQPQPALSALTERQKEVLRLVAQGLSTKQIAARLGLSAKTVEAHRGAITERLGIRDIAGLVRFAIRVGLIGEER
jgi:DNA-binding NarL/FixJ family response regulator